MISESVPIMTVFDLAIIGGVAVALVIFLRNLDTFRRLSALWSLASIVFGLIIIAAFYFSDLVTMHVLPMFYSLEASMAEMHNLHLHHSWFIKLLAVAFIVFGVISITQRMAHILKDLNAKEQSFHQELQRRESSEEKAREGEDRLRLAVELAGLGTYVWDSIEDKCLYCSPEHASIHGTTVKDYIARGSDIDGPFLFTHPEDRERVRSTFKSLREGNRIEFEYRVVTPSGEVRNVREIAKPIFDQNGAVIREYGTTQDITDFTRSQEQLRQSQKLEALGQLTGGIAHDFNNMLAVIMGNCDFLQKQLGDDHKRVQSILRAASHGAELTERLLAFARRQSLSPQDIDLQALLADMSDMMSRTLGESIEIKISPAPGLWPVSADPVQLESAILNLAINARDAMPRGGTLSLEAANAELGPDTPVSTSGCRPGRFVVLTVRDTGTGMSEEVLSNAFEPFFTTKDVGEGSGLGLSMVYGFVQQSGGHVALESRQGEGTTLKLYLPRGEAPEAAESAAPATAASAPQEPTGKVVMVVEDDRNVREIAVTLLRDLGYEVLQAADGEAAIAVLEDAPRIDLLLCDLVLPGGMAGPEVAERRKRRHPASKVLFMTGYAGEDVQEVARKGQGPDNGLLRKPFRKRELAEKVRQALGAEADQGRIVRFEEHLRSRRVT